MQLQIEERIQQIQLSVKITDIIPEIRGHGSYTCPCCGKRGKFSVWNDQSCKCWSSSCELNNLHNVISLYRWQKNLNEKAGFYQALNELENLGGINTKISTELFSRREQVLEQCVAIYNYYLFSPQGKEALNYLVNKRGFDKETLKLFQIGYAPHSQSLSEFDIDLTELKNCGLITEGKEYYANRIIFPIRNFNSKIVHFTGRYLGDPPKDGKGGDLIPRYKDTKTINGLGGTKNYLAFENRLDPNADYLIIAEGYPDTLSLQQKGIHSAGLLGLEKLTVHSNKFGRIPEIIFLFDNDKYPGDHPKYPGQYKSWRQIIPQMIDLQILLKDSRLYIYIIPEEKGKDINDWLSKDNLKKEEILNIIYEKRIDFIDYLIEENGNDLNEHSNLIKLINVTGRGKQKLEKFIPPEINLLEYTMRIIGK